MSMKSVRTMGPQMPGYIARLTNQPVISPRKENPEQAIIEAVLVIIIVVNVGLLIKISCSVGPEGVGPEGVVLCGVAAGDFRFK